jgi:hypothetical protein
LSSFAPLLDSLWESLGCLVEPLSRDGARNSAPDGETHVLPRSLRCKSEAERYRSAGPEFHCVHRSCNIPAPSTFDSLSKQNFMAPLAVPPVSIICDKLQEAHASQPTKLQHLRGVPGINALRGAPVLEFHFVQPG